ncbi:MAG: putative lipid II flippase FtsW [Methylococcaceae bacterium]
MIVYDNTLVLGGYRLDKTLFITALVILTFGFIMMSSASLHLHKEPSDLKYPLHQFIHIVIGMVAAGVVMQFNMKFWEKSGPWLFILGLALLVVVLIVGKEVNGAQRWLALFGISIQVSEIVKLFSVIYMAGYVTRHLETVRNSVYGLLKPLLLFAFACILLLLEPDFGSAVILLTIALGVMFLGGARLWQFILLFGSVSAIGVMLIIKSAYRLQRITSFWDPWADADNTGYQLVNALIAFGRGEWFGVGLGSSIQKMFFLPESHTDFLFSVIAEELGFIGASTVIFLFTILIWRAIRIGMEAERAGQFFSAYVAYGIAIWIGFQAIVNMGVNMGSLPTKGLTLPLMSYGGGSVVITIISLSILCRIYNEVQTIHADTPKGKPEWVGAS